KQMTVLAGQREALREAQGDLIGRVRRTPRRLVTVLAMAGLFVLAFAPVFAGLVVVLIGAALVRRWVPRRRSLVGWDATLRELRVESQRQWQRMRLLQTHTVGWSGKLTAAAAGAELGRTRQLEQQERPLTQPELVDDFRRFL